MMLNVYLFIVSNRFDGWILIFFFFVNMCAYVNAMNLVHTNCVYTFFFFDLALDKQNKLIIDSFIHTKFEIDPIISNDNLWKWTHKWIEPINLHSKLVSIFQANFYMRYQKKVIIFFRCVAAFLFFDTPQINTQNVFYYRLPKKCDDGDR